MMFDPIRWLYAKINAQDEKRQSSHAILMMAAEEHSQTVQRVCKRRDPSILEQLVEVGHDNGT